MMQGQRDLQTVVAPDHERADADRRAHTTAPSSWPRTTGEDEETELQLIASYGYKERKAVANRFKLGEGLVGQAALERKPILITQAPEDYIKIASGLGEAAPINIIVLPVLFEDHGDGGDRARSFAPFTEVQQTFLEQLIGDDRRRPEHDHREHAHRGAAARSRSR